MVDISISDSTSTSSTQNVKCFTSKQEPLVFLSQSQGLKCLKLHDNLCYPRRWRILQWAVFLKNVGRSKARLKLDEKSCSVPEALLNPPCFTPAIDFIIVGFTVSSSEILEARHQSSSIANVNISVPRLWSSLNQKPEVVHLSIMVEWDIKFCLKSFLGCYSCVCDWRDGTSVASTKSVTFKRTTNLCIALSKDCKKKSWFTFSILKQLISVPFTLFFTLSLIKNDILYFCFFFFLVFNWTNQKAKKSILKELSLLRNMEWKWTG